MTKVCIEPKRHGNCMGHTEPKLCARCKNGVDEAHIKAARKTKKYNDRMRERAS